MTLRTRLALLLGPAVVVTLAACTPAMVASIFGAASAAAPVVSSVLDAYTATAKAIAPAASEPDIRVLADLLRKRDECTVTASAALMPDAGAEPDERDKALEESAAATRALLDAVRTLTAAGTVDAGAKEGGGA